MACIDDLYLNHYLTDDALVIRLMQYHCQGNYELALMEIPLAKLAAAMSKHLPSSEHGLAGGAAAASRQSSQTFHCEPPELRTAGRP